ncbi:MAG: hypothetical protein HGB05_20260, partial [Chloroflexi bacterium]|nr:hypothetical protein [Chloroflexota bacterium]
MSPDIEWHVGEDAEQETIANTSNARRSRRSLWAVIIAIGLGVGLALLYRSIPESSPKPIDPTPAPAVVQSPLSPLPTPESIAAAIERDAQRLSASAGEATRRITFDDSAKVEYAEWYTALQNAYGQWGPPSYQTLYTVFETGTLPSGVTWVKLGQFRHGDFYRHTRFYRLENDRWVWTLPDRSFWSGATAEVSTGDAGAIGPVTILHPIEDAPVVGAVFDRFTRAYLNLCESLKCPPPANPARLWTPGLTLTITIRPALMRPDVQERPGALSIAQPSPRVVGYYEDANAPGDPYVAMAYAILVDPIVRLASGDGARWETDRGGKLFLQAVVTWKQSRLREELAPLEVFYPQAFLPPAAARPPDGRPVSLQETYVGLLRTESRLPLVSLWDWPAQGQGVGLLQHVAANEAEAVIVF